jgi:hypothetical protein
MLDTHIPGTIGSYADRKIRTRTSMLRRFLEDRHGRTGQWRGRIRPNGGFAADVRPFPMFRATVKQAAGINPLPHGNNVPRLGAPMGSHHDTGQKIACDPLSWHKAGMITNPSIAFMSSPSAGKSSALRVMMRGMAAHGVRNMVVGDIKDEHGQQIVEDGGNRISLTPGRGTLNVLDPGGIHAALEKVEAELGNSALGRRTRKTLLQDMHMRRTDLVTALVSIHRGREVDSREEGVVDGCLRHMYDTNPHRVPILSDLVDVINDPPESVKRGVNWRGDEDRYLDRVDDLVTDLSSICESGTLGAMFNGQTEVTDRDGQLTNTLDYSNGLAFDLSGIRTAPKLMNAAYVVSWLVTFGVVETSHTLADAGIAARESFMVWLDEFWQPLAASKSIVDKVNRAGRTNRTDGVGIGYALHSLFDLEAVRDDDDRAKAANMIGHCGVVWLGGMGKRSLDKIEKELFDLTSEERAQLQDWNNPAFEEEDGWIPGRGCFLAKRANLAGIPYRVDLAPSELAGGTHDTSKRLDLQAA